VAVDTRRGRAYCTNFVASSVTVVDTDNMRVAGRVPLRGWPCAVAVSPLLDEYYVVRSFPGGIVRISAASGETLREISAPAAAVGLAVGPAGDRLYLGNRGDGSVSVLGLDGLEWARIPVGAAPGGVTVHPGDPRLLLVANSGDSSVTVARDLLDGPPTAVARQASHPLVGQQLPGFSLPDLRSGVMRDSREWAEKKYILNFFASW
jgi:DNA-binding beta-propeller fold protein YncE